MKLALILYSIECVCLGMRNVEAKEPTLEERYRALESGIPRLSAIERGMVLQGDFGRISLMRLCGWSQKLKPTNEAEFQIAQRYFSHKIKEIRFIAIYSCALSCDIKFLDLALGERKESFLDAYDELSSDQFKSLADYITKSGREQFQRPAEQGSADQSATAPESKPEGKENTKPKSEACSQ